MQSFSIVDSQVGEAQLLLGKSLLDVLSHFFSYMCLEITSQEGLLRNLFKSCS